MFPSVLRVRRTKDATAPVAAETAGLRNLSTFSVWIVDLAQRRVLRQIFCSIRNFTLDGDRVQIDGTVESTSKLLASYFNPPPWLFTNDTTKSNFAFPFPV